MSRRNHTRNHASLGLAIALCLVAAVARAGGVPSHFVTPSACTSRPCKCDDIPMMQEYLTNQQNARDAFVSILGEMFLPSGPHSPAEVDAAFAAKFTGSTKVSNQFMMCSGYDPMKNSLSKVAGVAPDGSARVDPCLCDAFCQDIVDATVAHERTHPPTLIVGFLSQLPARTVCKTGAAPTSFCDNLDATIVVESEIASYTVGNNVLESSLNDLIAKDPDMPEMECTWMAYLAPQTAPVEPPATFFARVGLLLKRILWGEPPTEVAALDAAR